MARPQQAHASWGKERFKRHRAPPPEGRASTKGWFPISFIELNPSPEFWVWVAKIERDRLPKLRVIKIDRNERDRIIKNALILHRIEERCKERWSAQWYSNHREEARPHVILKSRFEICSEGMVLPQTSAQAGDDPRGCAWRGCIGEKYLCGLADANLKGPERSLFSKESLFARYQRQSPTEEKEEMKGKRYGHQIPPMASAIR